MINIDNTSFEFKIKNENNRDFIYDDIRKKWLLITPEEWVRQNLIQYIIAILHYPKSLIAVEKEIAVNQQRKRFDIVVYKNENPWMIIECKQTDIQLNDKSLQQILAYNTSINANYIVLSNGKNTHCWEIKNNKCNELNCLPEWI